MCARKSYGEPLNLRISVRTSEYNDQRAMDRKASPTGWWQPGFFAGKTLRNLRFNEMLLN